MVEVGGAVVGLGMVVVGIVALSVVGWVHIVVAQIAGVASIAFLAVVVDMPWCCSFCRRCYCYPR